MNESLAIIDSYNTFRDKMEQTNFQGFPDEIKYNKKYEPSSNFNQNDPNMIEMIGEDGILYTIPKENYNVAIDDGFLDKKKLDEERTLNEERKKLAIQTKKLNEKPSIFGIPLTAPDYGKGARGSILPIFPEYKNNLENNLETVPSLFSRFRGK
jgi:ABC-type glycerol-3-phosphate transport system substrate-binding protein